MSEPKPQEQYIFDRLEGSRMRDDWWGIENDEAEDIGASPLDLSNYRGDDVDELRGQIRLLTAALDAATSPRDGQGEALRYKLWLDDVRDEFAAAYSKVPPVFQAQWYALAVLLGVEE